MGFPSLYLQNGDVVQENVFILKEDVVQNDTCTIKNDEEDGSSLSVN